MASRVVQALFISSFEVLWPWIKTERCNAVTCTPYSTGPGRYWYSALLQVTAVSIYILFNSLFTVVISSTLYNLCSWKFVVNCAKNDSINRSDEEFIPIKSDFNSFRPAGQYCVRLEQFSVTSSWRRRVVWYRASEDMMLERILRRHNLMREIGSCQVLPSLINEILPFK